MLCLRVKVVICCILTIGLYNHVSKINIILSYYIQLLNHVHFWVFWEPLNLHIWLERGKLPWIHQQELTRQPGGKKKKKPRQTPRMVKCVQESIVTSAFIRRIWESFFLFCLILFPIDKKGLRETTYRPLLWYSIIQDVCNCMNQLLSLNFTWA